MAVASSSCLASTADSSGFSQHSWNEYRTEADFALLSPPVLSYAAGNLETKNFAYLISHDRQLFGHFVLALEAAARYLGPDDVGADVADVTDGDAAGARNADDAIIADLRNKINQLISDVKLFEPELMMEEINPDVEFHGNSTGAANPTVIKYFRLLQNTVSGAVVGIHSPKKNDLPVYILGVVVPPMSLSAFLAEQFEKVLDLDEDAHSDKLWLESNYSKILEVFTKQAEDLLDQLAATLTDSELKVLKELYSRALTLTTDFLWSREISQPSVAPVISDLYSAEYRLIFFSGFQFNCATTDMFPSLSRAHLAASNTLWTEWENMQNTCREDYETRISLCILPNNAVQYDHISLVESLNPLSDWQKSVYTRFADHGLLRGLELEKMKSLSKTLRLQAYCMNFFQDLLKNNKMEVVIHILSFCWCQDMIQTLFDSEDIKPVQIHVNQLLFDKDSTSTGEIVWKIETLDDMVKTFHQILENTNGKRNLAVYIGCDVDDLICLLEADIGIVKGGTLNKLGESFGISFVPLFNGLVEKQLGDIIFRT